MICITKYSGLDPEVGRYISSGNAPTLGQIGAPQTYNSKTMPMELM